MSNDFITSPSFCPATPTVLFLVTSQPSESQHKFPHGILCSSTQSPGGGAKILNFSVSYSSQGSALAPTPSKQATTLLIGADSTRTSGWLQVRIWIQTMRSVQTPGPGKLHHLEVHWHSYYFQE